MKKLFIAFLFSFAALVFSTGCGGSGGSSGAASGGDSGGGGGEASVKSLSDIPTLDLSSYDNSENASASISSPFPKSLSLSATKGIGQNLREVGKISRAGCESNMHKKEIMRMSVQSQLERCYPEMMETLGLITIPEGSYALYSLIPPEMDDQDKSKMCDNIPAEATEMKEKCLSGEGGGKGGKDMQLRIGRFDSELRIDMCEGGSLVNEATYTAIGSKYTGNVTHIGSWSGQSEKHSFNIEVELGETGKVTDGVVTLGSDGWLNAVGNMIGGFGSGYMGFEAIGEDSSNRVKGAFKGSFTDPFSGASSEFTGKVYSRFGGSSNTGCAKFSFTGTQPPMMLANMIPFNIGQDQLNGFLQSFGNELGIQITSSNYQSIKLCPNPNFDPENPSPTIKPMIVMTGATCPAVTNTGVECFSIKNIVRSTDFGSSTKQVFRIILSSASPYYDEVNAYDIAAMSEVITTPAYSRNWDCTGDLQAINFSALSREDIESGMSECRALEEKAFGNRGMGEYDCGKQEQMNGVDEFAKGGGGADEFGQFGGEYGFAENSPGKTNTCPAQGEPGVPIRAGRLFVDKITDQQYCIPDGTGSCPSFTITTSGQDTYAIPDDAIAIDNWDITRIDYYPATDVEVRVTFDKGGGDTCVQYYFLEQHSFNGPGEFGGSGGGERPGEAGFIPPQCLQADGTPVSEAECHQICSTPGSNCRG